MTKILAPVLLLVLNAVPVRAQVQLLIFSGLGGEPKYVQDFHDWGGALYDAARNRFGVPAENIVWLTENPERDRARIKGQSRRDDIERAIADMARRAGANDRVMIVMFGHGSSDSRGDRINLPGPDITATELAGMLAAFRTQPVVVVNTASASGGFQDELAGANRTIITATRTGNERNETIFGGFFVAAFAEDGSDPDRDGRITISEAFDYATRETERSYKNGGLLQLEHARMEGDAELAKAFHLGGAVATAPANASAEVRALYAERQRLEQSIDNLRLRVNQMETGAYEAELERLVLELARTNRAIQQQGGTQ